MALWVRKGNNRHRLPAAAAGEGLFCKALTYFVSSHAELLGLRAQLKVREVAEAASNLAAMAEELAASAQQISASAQEASAAAQEVQRLSEVSQKGLAEVERMLGETGKSLDHVRGTVQEVATRTAEIHSLGQQVAGIADQTNLLSLNAAIEAARAGEYGRGFAVVAQEVRKLAGASKEAVDMVAQLSGEIQTSVRQSTANLEQTLSLFNTYARRSREVSGSIHDVLRQTAQIVGAGQQIASVVQQQATATDALAGTSQSLAETADFGDLLMQDATHLMETVAGEFRAVDREIAEDAPVVTLALRLIDHAEFLHQLVPQAGRGGTVKSHTECAFGRWYGGEGRQLLGHLAEYQAVDEPHRRVHEAAAALAREGTAAAAEQLVRASLDLLHAFLALKHAVQT